MTETKPATRATPAPPRSAQQKSFLAPSSTEKPVAAADNMKGEKLVGMTFNMPQSWHTRFKMSAVSRGLDMKELLVQCFDAWEREELQKAEGQS